VDCEDVTVWFPGEGYDEYQTYNDCGGPADCNGAPCMGGQCGATGGGGGGDTCPIGYVKLCPQTVPVCDPNRKAACGTYGSWCEAGWLGPGVRHIVDCPPCDVQYVTFFFGSVTGI